MKHTRRKVDGAKLREIRQDRETPWSLIDLAKAMGWSEKSYPHLARIEAGRIDPTPKTLMKIAAALGVGLDEFSTREPVDRAA
jgi:transcriptional regulator with XRE-family HTH domain